MRNWIAAVACVGCTNGAGLGAFESAEEGAAPTTDYVARTDSTAPTQMVANIIYQKTSTNLIVNGSFEDYQDPNVPAAWSVDEIYGYRGMYQPTEGWRGNGVRFVRNAQGRHSLAQEVQVAPHHSYTVQMVFQVLATDSRRGGLYIVDPTSGTVIAGDDLNRPTNGWRIASATFDSGERTRVVVKIGYPAGMNGTAIYDGVSMFEDDPALHYRYATSYRDVMGIAAQPVDDLVPQLADYVTVLLSAPRADRVAHHDAYGANLPYYLDQFLSAPDGDASRGAWCQRTSLALGELLAMYGVRTRQVHAKSLQHQFLEYYDGAKWVVFDAYYGIRYVRAGARLGLGEVIGAGLGQVSIEVPTTKHVFLLELGYLMPIWDARAFAYGLDM